MRKFWNRDQKFENELSERRAQPKTRLDIRYKWEKTLTYVCYSILNKYQDDSIIDSNLTFNLAPIKVSMEVYM